MSGAFCSRSICKERPLAEALAGNGLAIVSITFWEIAMEVAGPNRIGSHWGPSGANRKVFRDCLAGRYRPLMGAALFTEYESLLARDPPFKHSALNSKERENLFDAFLSVCQWTNIYYGWRPNLEDEADNHLVELAVAGGAEMIVTNNIKDFKDFKRSELHFPGLRIVTPQTLLKEES